MLPLPLPTETPNCPGCTITEAARMIGLLSNVLLDKRHNAHDREAARRFIRIYSAHLAELTEAEERRRKGGAA